MGLVYLVLYRSNKPLHPTIWSLSGSSLQRTGWPYQKCMPLSPLICFLDTRADPDLVHSWSLRYYPWLTNEINVSKSPSNKKPSPSSSPSSGTGKQRVYVPATSAFLQSAQWILASHHLPDGYSPSTKPDTTMSEPASEGPASSTPALSHKKMVQARLMRVLRKGLYNAMMGLDCSLPAIRALMVLSQWTNHLPTPSASPLDDDGPPKEGEEAPGLISYDGEMFLTVAMHIASRMHLELDVETAVAQKKELEQVSGQAPWPPGFAETLDRARLVSSRKFRFQEVPATHPSYNSCFPSRCSTDSKSPLMFIQIY